MDKTLAASEHAGYRAGVAAGTWLLDGNSSEDDARRLLAGIEDGDPMVLDSLPCAPLSGQWADGLTPRDVLSEFDMDEDDDAADDVLSAFEDGYSRGVEDEASRSARAMLDAEFDHLEVVVGCGICGGYRHAGEMICRNCR